MKIRTEFFSFRNRVVVIVVGVTLGALSLLYTNCLLYTSPSPRDCS